MNMKKIALVIFSALAFTACKKQDEFAKPYQVIADKEKEMAQLDSITLEARQNFDDFKLAVQMKDTTMTNFFVKQEYKIPNADTFEHLWIRDVAYYNDTLKGVVDNTPTLTKEVKHNDTIVIDDNKISDWMYYKGRKIIGGYSVKFERNKLNDAQKAEFDKQYNAEFD